MSETFYCQCVPAIMNTFSNVGEEQEKSAKEARVNLKTLESGLNGKCCFGVDKIGFTDVAAAWIGIWGRIVQEIVNIKLIDEETMPVLTAWLNYVLEDPILKECVPPYQTLLEHNKGFRKILLAAAST
jgi:glutathione S-transferase